VQARIRSPLATRGTTRAAARRTWSWGAALAVAALAGACSSGAGDAQRLTVTGSSTLAPLVAEIAKGYEATHPDVRIDVQSGGSSRGIADVRDGLAEIGMVSRALRGEERSLHAYPIARDGVAVIVHAENPVRALTGEQVLGIYRGEIRRWTDVGGTDRPIVVVNKAEGRATLDVFAAHFGLDLREIRADVVIGDNEQGVKTVAGSPGAIGYVSIGTALHDIASGVPIALVTVDGVAPTLENVRSGAYPVARPLNLVTREPAAGRARAFLDYARSPAAADVFRAQKFVQVDG